MLIWKGYRNSVILSIIFFINPLFGVILSFFQRSHILLIVLISVFIGIAGYNFIPQETNDLSFYYKLYDELLSQRVNVNDTGANIVISYFIKMVADLGISKEFIPFISGFFSYFFILLSCSVFIKERRLPKYYYLMAILCISFMSSVNGIRSGLSTAIYIYGLVNYYLEKSKSSYAFFIISGLIHAYIIPCIIISILAKNIRLKLFYILLVIFSFSLMYFNVLESLLSFIFRLFGFEQYFDFISKTYIHGEKFGLRDLMSYKIMVVNLILSIPFIFSFLITILKRDYHYFDRVIILISCISIVSFDYWVIFERYQYVVLLCFLISAIQVNRKNILFLFSVMNFLSCIWFIFRNKDALILSLSFIYKPFIMSFF